VPYDGAPYSERYAYEIGPVLYFGFGLSGQRLAYLEYLDRVERAERFGYRVPTPPKGCPPAFFRYAR
jgi:hypothetical protein